MALFLLWQLAIAIGIAWWLTSAKRANAAYKAKIAAPYLEAVAANVAWHREEFLTRLAAHR